MRLLRPLLPPLLVLLASCDIFSPKACTAEFVYGLEIRAVSAADGAEVTDGLAGFLADGSYTEEMEVHGNRLVGAGERAGTYTARVTADEYVPWTMTGIRVDENECHAIGRDLTAELVPREDAHPLDDSEGDAGRPGRAAPHPPRSSLPDAAR